MLLLRKSSSFKIFSVFASLVQGAYLNQTRCRIEQIYVGKSGWGHKQYSSLPDAWCGGGCLCQAWGHGKERACLWDRGKPNVLCTSFLSYTPPTKQQNSSCAFFVQLFHIWIRLVAILSASPLKWSGTRTGIRPGSFCYLANSEFQEVCYRKFQFILSLCFKHPWRT